MKSNLMTYKQAAEYLAISIKTLRGYKYQGRIAYIRYSHTAVKFRREDLDRFISKHYQKAVEG